MQIIPVAFEAAWVLAYARSAQSQSPSMLRGFTRLPQARNFNYFGYGFVSQREKGKQNGAVQY